MYSTSRIKNNILSGAILAALLFAAAISARATSVPGPGCVTSTSTAWVNSALPQAETGSFRVTFDATPAGARIDGVAGLSSGPATGYASLAAIVRFNDTGTIDSRNGANYAAASSIPYSAATTYHFIMDVNIATHTYNAYVIVGSVQTTIGLNYAFRTQQANVSSLNNVGALTSAGTQAICNIAVSAIPTAPAITTQPVSQIVYIGQTATFSVVATGGVPLTYQWMKNGTAISTATSSSYATPAAAISDNSSKFTVVVTDRMGSLTSSAATLTVQSVALPLNLSSSALSFGGVNVSSSSNRTVTLTNAGTSNISISNTSISGAGFSVSGLPTGTILKAGQTAALNVTFAPAATGSVTGSVTVSSNATNSAARISLSGSGMAVIPHSVSLTWTASNARTVGYNIYSSTISGSSYSKLNANPIATVTFIDTTVQAGKTYYYVVTAVDSNNIESIHSPQAIAVIP